MHSRIKNTSPRAAKTTDAASILFGKTRQAVLILLFEQPDRRFHLRELARLTTISSGALQVELGHLVGADLVLRQREHLRVTYQANATHPAFPDLQGLIRKTCGVPVSLQASLAPLRDRITWAAIYGSFARGQTHARSDIDLCIVGDLELEEALTAIFPLEQRIGREISVRLFSDEEFQRRRTAHDPFILSLMASSPIPLVGDSNGP